MSSCSTSFSLLVRSSRVVLELVFADRPGATERIAGTDEKGSDELQGHKHCPALF